MDKLRKFLALAPIIAQVIPASGTLGTVEDLILRAEAEIARRMNENNQTREEVLADAQSTWDQDVASADDLATLGHEGAGQSEP